MGGGRGAGMGGMPREGIYFQVQQFLSVLGSFSRELGGFWALGVPCQGKDHRQIPAQALAFYSMGLMGWGSPL